MTITFWGAAGDVTGSMHQISTGGKTVLLDCGMYQGHRKEAEWQNRHFPFPPSGVDALLLSHAHIDHSGNIPLLVKNGFGGPIYATPATADLCDAMLQDTGHLQEQDAYFLNRHLPAGQSPVEPLYTHNDVEAALPLFRKVPYYTKTEVTETLRYTPYDAGHMLGSSSLVIECDNVRLAFSGDLGRPGLPIIRDPDVLPAVDYLILESTYGDRLHEEDQTVIDKLAAVANRTIGRGGKLIIPAFAVGRVQQIVLLLHELFQAGRVPRVPVFVDSPLAVNVTEVYRAHPECFDEETRTYLQTGDPFGFAELQYLRERTDSQALNGKPGPYIVISPSGMCEAGRVLHHLKHGVEDARNTVLIAGYQAQNTLGRKLLDHVPEVMILNERKHLRAEVASLQALSGHADRDELLAWIKPLIPTLKKVFLVHGESDQAAALATNIQKTYGVETVPAVRGQSFLLI